MANVTRMRCPASMLANSRMASEKGRTMNVEMNSMNTMSGRIAFGTPGGTSEVFMYLPKPCREIPTMLKMNQTRMASKSGTALRAFPGNWMNGKISKMLMKKMKKNIVVRKGR